MLDHRLLAVFSVALTLVAACSSGGSSSSASATAGTGGHASTSGGTGGITSASGSTGGAAVTSSSTTGSGGAGGAGGTDAGPHDSGKDDADTLDANDDALGKGGLKPGVACGAFAASLDAGTCGEGLSCCFPCKEQMCDSVCVVSCNPHTSGCEGGCIPQL